MRDDMHGHYSDARYDDVAPPAHGVDWFDRLPRDRDVRTVLNHARRCAGSIVLTRAGDVLEVRRYPYAAVSVGGLEEAHNALCARIAAPEQPPQQ